MGAIIGLKAFGVAMIGGLGSAYGIIVCALGFGILEFAIARVFSTAARDFGGFLLIILVLSRYPTGLFGTWMERKQL
jgi:branched-chain amino acid transport system permease protein